MEERKKGSKYWTVAAWTSKGMRPEETVWQNDFVDRRRATEGNVFDTKKEADIYLDKLNTGEKV